MRSTLATMSLALTLAACGKNKDADGDTDLPVDTDVEVVNAAPTAPEVALFPVHLIPDVDATCLVTVDSTDPDDDAVTYTFSWTVDGALVQETSDTLPGSQFDAGNTVACTVTPNDGIDDGPPITASADVGPGCGARRFEGDARLVAEGSDPSIGSGNVSRTLEFWLFATAWDRNQTLVWKADANPTILDYALRYVASSDALVWTVGTWQDPFDPPPRCFSLQVNPPSPGQWHHVAITYDKAPADNVGTSTIWIDGTSAGSCTAPVKDAAVVSPLRLGARYVPGDAFTDPSWAEPFDGVIDELRISDSVRYSSTFEPEPWYGSDANTLLLYHFEDGADAVADSSDASIDATVSYDSNAPRPTTRSTCDTVDTSLADDPPTRPSVALDKRYPPYDEPLTCIETVVAVDPEGAALTRTWAWYEDGLQLPTTSPTLPAASLALGSSYQCTLTVTDGTNNLAPASSAEAVIGDVCESIAFDGTDYVTVPYSASFPFGDATGKSRTVEAWVRPESFDADGTILALSGTAYLPGDLDGTDMALRFDDTGVLLWETSNAATGSCANMTALAPALGEWVHVAGTITRAANGTGTKRLFIQGQQAASCTFTASGTLSITSDVLIGASWSNGTRASELRGDVAEVRLSSSVRYVAPFDPVTFLPDDANTIAVWHMDEGSGLSLTDGAGNAHTAIITPGGTQGTWVGDGPCE